ncbi:polysaccharide deacetylase family protein [Teredinibacter waterburyi]|jgi:Predicted xylanase/chitin deacetylase|uniref:polysaccharide deacetylase family protein n=1 Tax=Teredinibacter waterburyi TaxID=1500538 RepID=UPI00165F4B7A|nr:polysaccharide deacetylase family protein [Teredinibacter waterburyi]
MDRVKLSRLAVAGLIVTVLSLVNTGASAGDSWNHKRAAVSLTYDDSLNVHIDRVAPALEARDLLGTFYITSFFEPFRARVNDWRRLAHNGHELGNHTLFHPCEGSGPGRGWVSPHLDLSKWTAQRVADNILMNNTLLEAVDGRKERTLAFPCGDTLAGGASYLDRVESEFVALRSVGGTAPKFTEVDLAAIPSYMVNGNSFADLKAQVDNAIAEERWLVFLFHGVGGEHSLDVAAEVHDQLLDYLQLKREQVWVAPTVTVAKYIAAEKGPAEGRKTP